jgi:hypothetical protein
VGVVKRKEIKKDKEMKENGKALHRHDISDRLWEKIEGLLPRGAGKQGRMAHDNRRFINAVSWIIRTGAFGETYP